MKKALPFILLALILSFFGGGYLLYRSQETKQAARRGQTFADLSQCLFGELIQSPDETSKKMDKLQMHLGYRPPAMRGMRGGKPWPQNCVLPAKDMMAAVRESTLLDDYPKREMLKELDALVKELEAANAANNYLARPVLAVWRAAEKGNVVMAKSSDLEGPPSSVEPVGFGKSTVANLEASANGPEWFFFGPATQSDDGSNVPQVACSLVAGGLSCTQFTAEESFLKQFGSFDSPTTVLFTSGQKLYLLADGKLAPVQVPDFVEAAHVDEKGNVSALGLEEKKDKDKETGDERVTLVPKFFWIEKGKSPKVAPLDEVLKGLSEEELGMNYVRLIGREIIVIVPGKTGESRLVSIPIQPDGTLGKPADLGEKFANGDSVVACRAGANFVLAIGSDAGERLVFRQKGASKVQQVSESGFVCSPNGYVGVSQKKFCNPDRCVDIRPKKKVDDLMKPEEVMPVGSESQKTTALIGDQVVSVWTLAIATGGGSSTGTAQVVFGSFGAAGSDKEPKETVLNEATIDKAIVDWNLYSSSDGAVLLTTVGRDVAGIYVSATGEFSPMKVTLKK
ncbi:MAG: hypothetical protein U0271_24465 [Polyangiaceae bacterium]